LIVSKKGVSTIGDALRLVYNSDRVIRKNYSVFFSEIGFDSFLSVPSLPDSVLDSPDPSSLALPFFRDTPDGERWSVA